MITEKIKDKIKHIETPILLFFDKEEEFKEEILAIEDPEIKVLIVNKNYFQIKYTVEITHPNDKILLYHPFEKPTGEGLKDYPLTDLLFANEELIIDESADILDRFAIHHSHAPLLLQYKRFIKASKYQNKILPVLSTKPFNDYLFKNTIVSLLLNERKTGSETMNLISLFEIANESEASWNKVFKSLQKEKLNDFLKELIHKTLNIQIENISFESMQTLLIQLKYNIITFNIKTPNNDDPYKTLKINDVITLSRIEQFFKDWLDDKFKSETLNTVFENLGEAIDESKIIDTYGVETDFGLKTKKINQIEVEKIAEFVKDNPSKVIETIIKWKLEDGAIKDYQIEIDFLWHTSKYYNLIKNYIDFDFNYLDDYIEKYKNELFALDLHYRHAYTYFQIIERERDHNKFLELFDELNKSYDRFLIDLNQSWLKILSEHNFDFNAIKTAKQFNFYNDFVNQNPNKKVVIISDGFRYELAEDLIDELKTDATNKIELDAMISSIPSYTNLGMSNLLPNNGIEEIISESGIDYSINGIKTNSSNREKILQLKEPESSVQDYAEFMRLSTSEQREILKANKVTYIYHNWMDTIGDRRSSEYYTFESVEECINQLKLLVKKLYNSLNTYNIYITADHGFLFNYRKIKENSRQVFPSIKNILKEHTRFCITSEAYSSKENFTFSLSNTTNIESNSNVILPKGINRFRKKGGFGVQFVHGGASLQEAIVPVMFLTRQRYATINEITFSRIDSVKTIANSSSKFKFLQNEPIGSNYQGISILVGIYDINNQLLTNELKIDFNSISENPSERTFELKLDLNSLGANSSIGYLKCFKLNDPNKLNPIINDLIKINTLTDIDEFN